MKVETATSHRVALPIEAWHVPPPLGPNPECHLVYRERTWRDAPGCDGTGDDAPSILVSRWLDERTARHERSAGTSDRYVISVALRPVRLRLERGSRTTFEGTMPAGMVHVPEPGQVVDAEFFTPCDFIHFHVAASYLRDRQAAVPSGHRSVGDLLLRDDLTAQLSRTLTEDLDGGDPLYAHSVGQTILMRVLSRRPPAPRVSTLPKWRLRRVLDYVSAKIAEPISLADLAAAAGLSRMRFAAQFRVATGCRPYN